MAYGVESGGVVREGRREVVEADPDGAVARHLRTIDVLDNLLARGAISGEMRCAGRAFERDFALAALHRMPLSRMEWTPRGGAGEMTDRQCEARSRVAEAIRALGGFDSPAGCAAWHVLGMRLALSAFARREGWRGRPIDWGTAQGLVIAALGMLAVHYERT